MKSARLIFNRAFDRRPALIVRCAGARDVARALEFAQNQNLPLAVRGGGHNRAGFSVCDGGVVIDLSGMNRVEVDAGKRVARAEAGALVRDLDQATQRFGLATTSGGCPTVGIAGLTLGGGEGLLMSKYGAACDNLISAQLVTVDGRQVEASENSNPDLFWAIRGGGGNFGVATALEYRLHPVTDVLTGTLTYPAGRIPELLQAFVKFVATAPDEYERRRRGLAVRTGAAIPDALSSIVAIRATGTTCSGRCERSNRRRTMSGLCPIWKLRRQAFFERPSRISKRTCFFRNSARPRLRRSRRQPTMRHQPTGCSLCRFTAPFRAWD